MERAQLKAQAKSQIKGNVGTLFLVALITGAICTLANYIPYIGSIAVFVVLSPAFALATAKIYLGLADGIKPEVSMLFSQFNQFWSAFKVQFLVSLFTALWSLLFMIPGIIKALSYSQATYILAENPEIGAREAIDRSKAMMDGHKMDLFVLYLSFIGWALLGAVTLGIGYIWIAPYMSATFTNFYNSIKPAVAVVEE